MRSISLCFSAVIGGALILSGVACTGPVRFSGRTEERHIGTLDDDKENVKRAVESFHIQIAEGHYKKVYKDSGGVMHKMRTESAFRDEIASVKRVYGDFKRVSEQTVQFEGSDRDVVKVYCETDFTRRPGKEEFLFTRQEGEDTFRLQYYDVDASFR